MWATKAERVGEFATFAELRRYQKDERGSLTIFGLFIFIMILMICGVAVDMMNYEKERIAVQNTLDTAVVAASSLNQDADTNAEVTALVKDYFEKAGYDPDIVTVTPDIEIPAGGDEETLRTVKAVVDYDLNTMFMNMVGVESLPGAVGGIAQEGQQLIEIALVLDISGSMGWGDKLANMKEAAKRFVTIVLDNNGADRVMISIIPYNMQVQMSADLMDRLAWNNPLSTVEPAPTHPGAIGSYYPANDAARCARFLDGDFDTSRLAASAAGLARSAKFARGDWSYNVPGGEFESNAYWCGEGYPEMMLYQNDELTLHNHIDSLSARGMTAIDYGMKWATGVLDPSFRPVVQSMVNDTLDPDNGIDLVPPTVAGHPVDYGTPNVFKYIILMTDGANTQHLDLEEDYKSGPTRIWYSDTLSRLPDSADLTATVDPSGDPSVEFDGYLVEMPENDLTERWYRPRSPTDSTDDEYLSEAQFQLLADIEQWSYHQLYERFSVRNVGDYFFQYSDWPARTAHRNAEEDIGGYGAADVNLRRICSQAQTGEWITVFAVAFEAPEGGVNALQDCIDQGSSGTFFSVAGDQLITEFENIAAEITKLRLTQ